ncbi:hypothetical protein PHG01_00844 [Streptococcus mutans PKUSS-HG01]|nr:hypothetical protein PHG01_00844 [Streptococcus mutans PKUSS-HG01]
MSFNVAIIILSSHFSITKVKEKENKFSKILVKILTSDF